MKSEPDTSLHDLPADASYSPAAASPIAKSIPNNSCEDDFDDFMPATTYKKPKLQAKPAVEITKHETGIVKPKVSRRVPTIYFGTRTHKQVAQIVSELKRTPFRPRMTILGSRNQYCIHSKVAKASNKNESCLELLETKSCRFFDRVRNIKASNLLQPGGDLELFDIEELVTVGKRVRGCPYYASKLMAETAEIVFCPYNYLIDPELREVMDISVTSNIFIFDEAHNIEDSARAAGSLEVADAQLERNSLSLFVSETYDVSDAIKEITIQCDASETCASDLKFVLHVSS